jgi:hypothetical protein
MIQVLCLARSELMSSGEERQALEIVKLDPSRKNITVLI